MIISDTLSFSSHVMSIARKCSLISSWILRAFSVRDPGVYLRLYESYALPLIVYCCHIWSSCLQRDMLVLEKMQRRFLKRVEWRCNLPRNSLEFMSVCDRVRDHDARYLRRLIKSETLFDELFKLRATDTRRGFVLETTFLPRTVLIERMFPSRVAKMINSTRALPRNR